MLSGGITNRNFLVNAPDLAERYVIRMGGTDTHLLGISREAEQAATAAAAAVGVGPEVVAFIRPEGFLVTRFIIGSPISPEQIREPAMLERVADSLRRIHGGPAIPGVFVPLRIVEGYRALAADRGVPIPAAYERAREAGRRIERALLASPIDPLPCHNDLLNANFIDDGARMRIVDWEYAGMGDPFFDLGNFSINHELSPEADEALLQRLRRRGAARQAGAAQPHAGRVRLPRGDVGRAAAGHQQPGRRLRGLRGRALRAAAGERVQARLRARAAARRRMAERDGLPDRARVVIIGGGVGGAAVAYHLTRLGWTGTCSCWSAPS